MVKKTNRGKDVGDAWGMGERQAYLVQGGQGELL